MKLPPDDAQATLGAVQTARDVSVVGFRQCPVCGGALTGRQKVACSEKCRAIRWRQGREVTRQARDEQVAQHLRTALRLLDGGQGDG